MRKREDILFISKGGMHALVVASDDQIEVVFQAAALDIPNLVVIQTCFPGLLPALSDYKFDMRHDLGWRL